MLGLDDLFQTQGADLSGQLESPLNKIQRGPGQFGTGQETGHRLDRGQDRGQGTGQGQDKATWPDRTGTRPHGQTGQEQKRKGEQDCERTDHNPDSSLASAFEVPFSFFCIFPSSLSFPFASFPSSPLFGFTDSHPSSFSFLPSSVFFHFTTTPFLNFTLYVHHPSVPTLPSVSTGCFSFIFLPLFPFCHFSSLSPNFLILFLCYSCFFVDDEGGSVVLYYSSLFFLMVFIFYTHTYFRHLFSSSQVCI
jgi:hypothetical protein